ncbi:MAG: DUF4349 domain-containing protein [Clostridiales bacterium]|nr:DUF4349 domain-containing protein [Clostridiales bacterium]
MKKTWLSGILATVLLMGMVSGCSKNSESRTTRNASDRAEATVGMDSYLSADSNKGAVSFDYAEETTAASWEAEEPYAEEEDSDDTSNRSNANPSKGGSAEADQKVNLEKEMLVYRCSIALDTLEFEQTLTALKTKIEEYHGFIERENQTDGTANGGRYILEEKDKDYYYTATIRIPSAYYDSFVKSTEGIGMLRSKNSSVDNVATRYGTLKNQLEIYEAEYDRYMKQYEKTEDEKVALQIQSELRNLAITISDIKTQMSMMENDVAYSYVTITIHKVTERELKVEDDKVKEEDSFGTRVSKAASESWNDFLAFLESILMFFIFNWWVLIILVIIAVVLIIIVKISIKKAKKKNAKMHEEHVARMEAEQKELNKSQVVTMKGSRGPVTTTAKASEVKTETKTSENNNDEKKEEKKEQTSTDTTTEKELKSDTDK